MSELIKISIKAIPVSLLSTLCRSSVLGNVMRTLGREIATQVAATKQMTANELPVSCTTQLISLNRALKTLKLSQLGGETVNRLTPSTVATLRTLERSLDTGRLTQTVTAGQITSALNEMTSAVQTAHKTLAKQEQRTITDDLRSVLVARGYTVQMKESLAGRMRLIRAKRREHVVAARIAEKGTLELDLAGFEAGKCTEERQAIVEQLQERGYQVEINQRVVHNRREGGEIVKAIEEEFQEIDERFRRLNLAKAQRSRRVRR
ncbi:MAG: hypothetical protein ACE5PV_20855 [Candidatus Poribacteria bacterium]